MSSARIKYGQSEDKAESFPMDDAEVVDETVCTIHSDNLQLADVLAHQVLKAHGDNEVQCVGARPGTDSSGRPCATSPNLSAVATLADHRSSPPAAQQQMTWWIEKGLGRTICPRVRQSARASVNLLLNPFPRSPTMPIIISRSSIMMPGLSAHQLPDSGLTHTITPL